MLGGALHDFCSETESADQADRILALAYRIHSPAVDRVIVTRLLDCFETPNPDIRSRIQQAFVFLVKDYSRAKPQQANALLNWTPLKDDSPAQVNNYTRAWRAWWSPQFGESFRGR